jgi:L-threonylcarbamoyladenylate synthase
MSDRILSLQDSSISIVAEAISNGSVCVFPTDTLYAISAVCNNDQSIERLIKIKERSTARTLPILVNGIEMAKKYVEFSEEAEKLAAKYWPGALTLVLPAKADAKISEYCIKEGMIAVRMPNCTAALDIISIVGAGVVGTSANLSGDNNLAHAQDISDSLSSEVEYILEDDLNQLSLKASTIIKFDNKQLVVIRQGDLDPTIPSL